MFFAKALAQTFYSTPVKWPCFNGCSEGGREAYEVAQRWPADYDGVVQGCESMDMTALVAGILNVSSKAGTPAALGSAQYAAAYASAVATCDGDDGLVDGYLANPASCNVDPTSLDDPTSRAAADVAARWVRISEVPGSHAIYVSQPQAVASPIEEAAVSLSK